MNGYRFIGMDGLRVVAWRCGIAIALAVAARPAAAGNPVFPGWYADPEVAVFGGRYFAWHIVYHRRPLGETDGNRRVTCINRMEFDDQGFIKPVKITFEGVARRPVK